MSSRKVQEELDTLDISTINAERRAHMLRFLATTNGNGTPSTSCNGSSVHESEDRDSIGGASNASNASESNSSKSKRSSLFSLRFFKKGKRGSTTSSDNMEEVVLSKEVLNNISVTSLPQVFMTKYLGSSIADGLRGIQFVRGPIDRLFAEVGKMKVGDDLPLVNLTVTDAGFRIDSHKLNRGPEMPSMMLPIESISYGVQDVQYCRVFCFIFIREGTGRVRSQTAECHVFVSPNPQTARKITLSLNLCFQSLHRRMIGQDVYSLDLRSPEQILCPEYRREEEDA